MDAAPGALLAGLLEPEPTSARFWTSPPLGGYGESSSSSARGGPNSLSAQAGQNKCVSVGAFSSSISVPSMARQPSIEPSPTLPHSAHRSIAPVSTAPCPCPRSRKLGTKRSRGRLVRGRPCGPRSDPSSGSKTRPLARPGRRLHEQPPAGFVGRETAYGTPWISSPRSALAVS
jgi:hypothetical protein